MDKFLPYRNLNYDKREFLPFTFDSEDFIQCRKKFRSKEVRGHHNDPSTTPVPTSEAYTGRFFTHDFIFEEVDIEGANVLDVPWYYEVSNWKGLKKWLGSEHSLDRPKDIVLSYHEWNPIGVDNEEE